MSEMNQFISDQIQLVIPGIVLILLILFILVLVQGGRIRTMRRKYEAMMSGTGIDDLETLLIDLKNQNDMLEEAHGRQEDALRDLQEKLKGMKGKVALKRYNAFGERGNDLSFSLAILDDRRSGIVITSLHSRDNSYIYAKPLEQGESSHPLSPEEKEVIALALQQI
ncbi:DUF4446 family protein [Paenibacillus sp. HN-1]|uniref:DUF4446 family protein n=1 Tax=Paenibacillus TaxID=44249 RepID=UPI001CAA3B60|nr:MULTISPECIES: DUF4446 family protein [Paenibacillus]MBY9082145.1 DUF4446 family protein [Paenibacillus sp. CGMCC 1.18879]MBY9082659.1 DUF4446 family protein [Paenibacillus sinensis]